ncbi:hypothetical protein Pelo_4546 [Pelomyxa schiedti]|nr:hypothetical protein Pelo_4546 [Pelomyxa schiedti]
MKGQTVSNLCFRTAFVGVWHPNSWGDFPGSSSLLKGILVVHLRVFVQIMLAEVLPIQWGEVQAAQLKALQ